MDQIVNIGSSLVGTTIGTAYWALKPVVKLIEKGTSSVCGPTVVLKETVYSLPPDMRRWIAISGLIGATAVATGAYGSHVVYPRKEIPDNRKAVFETANKYHFLHSLALMSAPLARRPSLTGGLFVAGIFLFSGSCYYFAITDNSSVSKYAPYGAVTLILAWLSLAL